MRIAVLQSLQKMDRILWCEECPWQPPMHAASPSAPMASLCCCLVTTSSLPPAALNSRLCTQWWGISCQNEKSFSMVTLWLKIGFSAWKSGRVEFEISKRQPAAKFLKLSHLSPRNSENISQLDLYKHPWGKCF